MDEPKQCDAPVRGQWSTSAQVDVEAARKTGYHSDGTGVLRVSSFLEPRATETLRQRWLYLSTEHWAEGLGHHEAGPGAPRYRIQGPHEQDAWCLGPWPPPPGQADAGASSSRIPPPRHELCRGRVRRPECALGATLSGGVLCWTTTGGRCSLHNSGPPSSHLASAQYPSWSHRPVKESW